MSETPESNPDSSPSAGPVQKELSGRIGKYEITRLLGKGAMGMVYLAFDTMLEREVALKVMVGSIADDPELKKRFEREARAVAKMTHPNVVMVFDLGYHSDGSPYLAMEALKGHDLQQALRKPPPMTVDRKVQVMTQVLAGLSHAHQSGIVHRDIKPANIFICEDSTVKIMDFGVARLTTASMTGTGNIVGTADYMSPEQVKGAKVDGRSDLFSVGCMLFEMLTGRRPFHSDNLMAIFYKITHEEANFDLIPSGPQNDALLPVLRKSLAKNLEDRYQTAYEFAVALREYLRVHSTSTTGAHALEDLLDLEAPPSQMPEPIGGDETEISAATMDLRPATGSRQGATVVGGAGPTVVDAGGQRTRVVGRAGARPGAVLPRPVAPPARAPLFAGIAAAVIGGGAAVWYVTQQQPAPPPTTVASLSPATTLPPATAPPTTQAPPPTTAPQPSIKAEGPAAKALREAQAAFRRGRYDDAIASAQAALREDPGNADAKTLASNALNGQKAEARFASARAALTAGDHAAALAAAQEGNGLAPWDGRGPDLIKQAQDAKAAAEAKARQEQQAARTAQINNLLRRADDALGASKFDEAIALYDQVLEMEPQNARAGSGRTSAVGARAVASASATVAQRPAAPAGKAFVAGKTQASSRQTRAGDLPPGFEETPGVKVERGTVAADLPGRVLFSMSPEVPKAGDKYTLTISFANDGAAAISIQSMVLTATINGKRIRNPVPPSVKDVAPRDTATLLSLPDFWRAEISEWSMEVSVNTSRGENYTNTLTWQ